MIDYVLFEKYANDLDVLLVDDDDLIKSEMGELLSDVFKTVEIASDGSEALNKYENYYNKNKKYFDIVISDVSMPNLNGVKLTEMILELNPEQNIVIISAYSEPENLIEFINFGVSQFITKPIEVNKFIKTLFEISERISNSSERASSKDANIITLTNSIIWNRKTKKLSKHDIEYKLTKKEILLLELLLSVTDKVYSVDEIISYIWEDNDEMQDIKNLKNIISRLRKKIPELIIENVYGLGYKVVFCDK